MAQLPALERALYRGRGAPIVLVTANVLKEEKKKENYAYRVDPRLQLRSVPTLYRWATDGPSRKLECASKECAEWNAQNAIELLIDS